MRRASWMSLGMMVTLQQQDKGSSRAKDESTSTHPSECSVNGWGYMNTAARGNWATFCPLINTHSYEHHDHICMGLISTRPRIPPPWGTKLHGSTTAGCSLRLPAFKGVTVKSYRMDIPLGVDGAQVGVLKESHQVGLRGLLQGQHCTALEAQVGLEVLCNLTHQPLEGQLADQQLS